jgi:hypothetical protein
MGLNRLLPGIKNSANWMGKLEESFGGAAEAAAKKDPLTNLQIVFGEMQETIGKTLLPYLNGFASWFVSIQPLISSLIPIVLGLVAGFVAWKVATTAMTIAMTLYQGVMALSTIATKGFTVALASTGIGAIAIAVGLLTAGLIGLNTQMDAAAVERPTPNAYTEDQEAKIAAKVAAARAKALRDFNTQYLKDNPTVGTLKVTAENINAQHLQGILKGYKIGDLVPLYGANVAKQRDIAVDKAALDAEAKARAALNKATPQPTPVADDTKLKDYLKQTQDQVTQLVKNYNDKVKDLTRDYQDALTKRIQDFKSAFAQAVSFKLGDMYIAGAQSGTALVDGLRSKLEGIKNFSSDIAKLTAAGFTSDFTQQIIDAGPIVGSEMSKAILSSSPEVQAQLKQLFADTQNATMNGVDFIGNSIVNEFKDAADSLSKALTELAVALNNSLNKIGTKLNTKLLSSTSKDLKGATTEIGNTRNLLNGSMVTPPTSRTVANLNQGALNNAGVNSTFQINTTALSNASPELITQTIVNGIKFGLPTLAGNVE